MSEHFDLVCQYGYKHGTCRCASPNKKVRKMVCNTPAHAMDPRNKADTDSEKLNEFYSLISEAASPKLDTAVATHEEYVLALHDILIKAKQDADAAQRALWPERGRGC